MIDNTKPLDRDVIAQAILDSIYDGDANYIDVALDAADLIIQRIGQ